MYLRLTILLCLFISSVKVARAQLSHEIRGKVVTDEDGLPLTGAVVRYKGSGLGTMTDVNGNFTLKAPEIRDTLIISFIGFNTQKLAVGSDTWSDNPVIKMTEKTEELDQVIANGYQLVPQERATGSFTHIDNELFNRRVSANILERMEDITPGLVFNRNTGAELNPISIRGQSSIFGNAKPLIVIDNFPYDGEISNINPNDVESITVLKDAAAASIWGTRAGNGVIVITTKKARQGVKLQVDLNANVQIGNRPDQFYQPDMSVADFIEMEETLFGRGYYQSTETSRLKYGLTPVVEILVAERDGKIDKNRAKEEIDYLKTRDVRKDLDKYFFRESISQQYSLGISGGTEKYRVRASLGRDQSMGSLVGTSTNRTSLNFNNSFAFFNKKLQVNIGGYYTQTDNTDSNLNPSSMYRLTPAGTAPLYPYARLADENGKPLPVIRDLRLSFIEQTQSDGLLGWYYVPLDELGLSGPSRKGVDYRFNTSLLYKITDDLSFETLLQYGSAITNTIDHKSEDYYFTRNLINRLTQIDERGNINRPIPLGGILDNTTVQSRYLSLRTQFNYSKLIKNIHHINALAGFEARDNTSDGSTYRLYGYDSNYETSKPVDYVSTFPLYVNPSSVNNTIPYSANRYGYTDHFLSYYSNFAYSYSQRYVFSASIRLDQSNLFGVESNQKGVPLWSTGAIWNISNESFYKLRQVPYLRARFTYGYNGNINKSVSGLTTARFSSSVDNKTRLPYLTIVNPPNPALRWEKVRMINAGLDFEIKGGRIGGSMEYYRKYAEDLIGNISLAPSSGIEMYTGNTARIKGSGVDLILNTLNLKRALKWSSTFIFSHVSEKVEKYGVKSSASVYISSGSGGGTFPLEGRPLYAFYSYAWAGLDPSTGDPQGYLEGNYSTNYGSIVANTTPETMVFHGSARPVNFGSFRNTISFKGLSISANISYRTGYYFRRPSINYTSVLRGQGGHADYSDRWMKPGDDLITSIPSMPASINSSRDNFYLFSSILVEKGDHVRFQDISLSFDLNKVRALSAFASRSEVYMYINNIGLIWRANSKGLDPDYYQSPPPPRTIALGLKLTL